MSMPHRASVLLSIIVFCGASTACFGTRGPALPDLSAERGEVTQRAERLDRIRQVMQRDLERVETLRAQFGQPDPGLYRPPFPLDLYKHVAVDCLNEPWDPNQLETSQGTGVADGGLGLTCHPEFGSRLLVELQEQVPQRREPALAKLHTLDELRRLRGTLRQRLERVPAILRASSSMLATRRAELRQMRASQARRRTEYSADKWRKLQQRFDAYEKDLAQLQVHIDRLGEVRPDWSPRLDQSVSMLYMELTKLSP